MKQLFIITILLTGAISVLGQGNPRDLPTPVGTSTQTVSPSSAMNYILTYSYREPFAAHPTTLYTSNAAAEIQYFDGLGRPIESVSVKGSPLGYDIIDYKVYDAYGNLVNEYLPFTKSLNNGVYVTQANFISGQNTFLTGLAYPTADVSKGYAVTEYEKSPLNRVVKQGAPGASWQLSHPVTTTYRTNTTADAVKTYNYTDNTPSPEYTFPAGKLFVTEKYDEDSKVVKEFKDMEGKLVQIVKGTLITKYCYDQFGLLRCVIQPMGASPASTDYCFYYKYDPRKRLIEKKIPGKETEYLIYDSRDRLVLTQDGEQRAKATPEWSYTIYDSFNRPVELGTWATLILKDALITSINNSLTYMSTQTRTPLKYLYYDVYTSCPTANAYYTADANALGAVKSTSNIGRQTGEKTALLDYETDMKTWLFKAIYYDKFGRVIQTVSDNHLPIAGSVDYVTNKYNFAGEVTQTRQRHVADYANNYTDTYMDLDHRGRLLKTRYSINGATAILMSANKYNEAGNLAIQYFHSENDGNFLQKNDYAYNIRGWMTQLNDPVTFTENDKFGLKLEYNSATSPATDKYNGNIAGLTWGTPSFPNMKYAFSYDNNNRITYANFKKSNDNGFDVTYEYDSNGNLTCLNRFGYFGNTYLDMLNFTYNGNKIATIEDYAGDRPNITDYPGSSSPVNFSYNSNGNLYYEPNKLVNIYYNLLNLPNQLVSTSGANRKIKYFYTFNGEKLRKTVEDNGTITKVDYCGPFVYETVSGTRSLKYIITPHGRAVKTGSTWDFEYNITDHLGNVRVVMHKGTNGLAAMLKETQYYPMGMEMSQLSVGSGTTNKYLYNGKEIQDDFGLYWYDYGARFYDPMIGRWHTIDPMAEKYPWVTPYSYCFNNPINSIDPDGREPITLGVLAVKGLIGAGIDISIQMTASMTLDNQSFGQAFRNIDWTSAGGSFIAGAVGIPGVTAISKTAKVATIATAVAVDAAVDVSITEGNENIFNGKKSGAEAVIDAFGSVFGGKASDDIVKGAKNSISNDISSGTFSTLNKAEKNTLRQTQSVVNSQGFEAGTKTTVGLGAELGKRGAESIIGTGNPSSHSTPLMQNYTQPSDNTRVARPIYPLPEFK